MIIGRRVAASAVLAVVAGLSSAGCAAKTYVVAPPETGLPSSTVATAAAEAPAAPAGELLNGVYTTLVGPVQAEWTIKSTCAATCTAVVSSSNGGWTGDATLVGTQWDITVERPGGGSCLNGATTPSTNHYFWDATTLKGAVDSSYTCAGEPPGAFHSDFTIVTPPISTS